MSTTMSKFHNDISDGYLRTNSTATGRRRISVTSISACTSSVTRSTRRSAITTAGVVAAASAASATTDWPHIIEDVVVIFTTGSAKILRALGIFSIDRIIPAVGKHVITEDTLTSGNEGVGVDEAADGGIVISGLQIIEPGILGGRLAKSSFFTLAGNVKELSLKSAYLCNNYVNILYRLSSYMLRCFS